MFNAAEPNGRHVLDLKSPYQRTVVTEILQLATDNPRCELSDISYTDARGFIIPLEVEQRYETVRHPAPSLPQLPRCRTTRLTAAACLDAGWLRVVPVTAVAPESPVAVPASEPV